jgi:hypothetical protein
MLKLWGMGASCGGAVAIASVLHPPVPRPEGTRRERQFGASAQNVVIAEAMLRQQKFGTLTRQERKEIAHLCDWSLSELYENDWAAFQQYWQWLREIDPNFIPRHSRTLRLASLVLGYESAEGLAHVHRWIRSSPARAVAWISNVSGRSKDYMLRGDAGALPRGRSRVVGAALVLVAGIVALAGLMATGQLGEAARPAHPPVSLAEAPRRWKLGSRRIWPPIPRPRSNGAAKWRRCTCGRRQKAHRWLCPSPRRHEPICRRSSIAGRTAGDKIPIGDRGRPARRARSQRRARPLRKSPRPRRKQHCRPHRASQPARRPRQPAR